MSVSTSEFSLLSLVRGWWDRLVTAMSANNVNADDSGPWPTTYPLVDTEDESSTGIKTEQINFAAFSAGRKMTDRCSQVNVHAKYL